MRHMKWVVGIVMCTVCLGALSPNLFARTRYSNNRNNNRRQRVIKTGQVTETKTIGGSTSQGQSLAEQHAQAFAGKAKTSMAGVNIAAIELARKRARAARTNNTHSVFSKR